MRVFTATFGAETNTFSPIPTALSSFAEKILWRPGQEPPRPTPSNALAWLARERGRTEGWEVTTGTCAWAEPAGMVVRSAFDALTGEILSQLAAASPVDLVALSLHGAMVADGIDDCEGELIARIRAQEGADVTIAVHLDPHCTLTERMVRTADLIVCMKEYPHTDFMETSAQLLDLAARTRQGIIKPIMALHDCHMIGGYHTTTSPMSDIVAQMHAMETQPGLLSVSIAHGFPWADVPESGTRVLVIADGDPARAELEAKALGERLRAIRGQTMTMPMDMATAIDNALAAPQGPIVLADIADNAGGGAPSDSTFLLSALLDQGVTNACLGALWDPQSVRFCFDCGEGATLPLRIGGKISPMSGAPLDVTATVTALRRGAEQTFAGRLIPLGDCAAIRVAGIDIVLTSDRRQALGPDLFTNLGIDPMSRKIVVVKSSQHFFAGFSPIAREVLYVNTPGALQLDFASLPYKRITRPIWPLDQV